MSRGLIIPTPARLCFPRVSGDEPIDGIGEIGARSFSPRERG